MITANKVIEMCEGQVKSIMARGFQVPIYENPDSSEISNISQLSKSSNKLIRFVADARKSKVYVVDGIVSNNDLRKALGLLSVDQEWKRLPYMVGGSGHISGDRIVLTMSNDSSSGETVDRISDLVDFLSEFSSPSQSSVDFIKSNTPFLSAMFKFNWSFADKYISGFSAFMRTEGDKFSKSIKNYDHV